MSFTVVYEGKWVSANQLRNNHWRKNQQLKEKYRKELGWLILEQNPKKMIEYTVDLVYNSRLDPDNVTFKYFLDSMKDVGVIIDDKKKYNKGISTKPDETLGMDTYIFTVTKLK